MGVALRDGTQISAADGNLDFTIVRRNGASTFLISGPTSKARTVSYLAGDEVFNIRLRPGVRWTATTAKQMVDADIYLSHASQQAFWFGTDVITAPNFNNAETCIDTLMAKGILEADAVVGQALSGPIRGHSLRSVQQHFSHTVGLSRKYLSQIQRAEKASQLLQQGASIISVAHEVGFTDQSHMSNSLRYFTGATPRQHTKISQDW